MNPPQDKNQSPNSILETPNKKQNSDTEDNLKKEKFATNPNLLHHKRIWKQAKSETLKKVFEDELKFLNEINNNLRTIMEEYPNILVKRIDFLEQKLKELETKK